MHKSTIIKSITIGFFPDDYISCETGGARLVSYRIVKKTVVNGTLYKICSNVCQNLAPLIFFKYCIKWLSMKGYEVASDTCRGKVGRTWVPGSWPDLENQLKSNLHFLFLSLLIYCLLRSGLQIYLSNISISRFVHIMEGEKNNAEHMKISGSKCQKVLLVLLCNHEPKCNPNDSDMP